MIKDIRYLGYTAQPSDYESPDGHLAASLNLLNEDGDIKPLYPPKEELSVFPGHEVLLIHAVPSQENFIILTGNRNGLFGLSWIKRSQDVTSSEGALAINLKSPLNTFRAISIVGNTLVVATAEGVFYILWKDDTYKFLGNRPPFLPISFGAYKIGDLRTTSGTNYTDVPKKLLIDYSDHYTGSNRPHISWDSNCDAFWNKVANQALGLLLSEVSEKVTSKGFIYQPFYIRYAFKLYDGSYSWHSAPILMLVSTHRPCIGMVCTTSEDETTLNVACSLDVPYFGISYQIFGSLDLLKEWSDIVRGVDVFISAPIYTYNQDGKIGLPISTSELFDNAYTGGGWNQGRPGNNSGFARAQPSASSKSFLGHYADKIDGVYQDHFVEASSGTVCNLAQNENFNDRIQHENLFYKVSSLDIDEIQPMSERKHLPLLHANITNLTTLEPLPDEYNSHATILAGSLHTYNQRLLMGDISIMPPKPFPMFSMAQETTKTIPTEGLIPTDAVLKIKVFTRINGQKCVSESAQPLPQAVNDPQVYPLAESFPRFLYHPDPSAYKMEITTPDGKFYSLPLKQHPFLNGAYWFGGLATDVSDISENPDEKDATTTTTSIVANKIYISDINNPFVFPAENIVTIGCGRIFRLCSAAKALSQGQFGQFPLYAFTDDGIWALEISATGTISARQPITRDVCINHNAICQIDSAVLIPTDRGIMHIAGSTATCISDSINSESPFNILQLPHMETLHSRLGHTDDSCLHIKPLSEFLAGCGMVYDYPHQRIIVFNKDYHYAYVLSLKSNLWGIIHSTLSYGINSYPEALAVNSNGGMVNFSLKDNCSLPGLLVTRPLKLDAKDVLKTIDTVIQRGHFRKGHVQSVLYGSRDILHWHLVWSSTDHYLRGFRGTPYKYFRIALLCNLAPDERISGSSIQFTPRLTNQLR